MMNWKGCGRKQSWPKFKVLSQHLPGVAEKNHENLSQNSLQAKSFELGPAEYKAGVLTTRP
jgi:hypothetical protein